MHRSPDTGSYMGQPTLMMLRTTASFGFCRPLAHTFRLIVQPILSRGDVACAALSSAAILRKVGLVARRTSVIVSHEHRTSALRNHSILFGRNRRSSLRRIVS